MSEQPHLNADGLENAEARTAGDHDSAGHLGVPMQLLAVLDVMDEQQLGRHLLRTFTQTQAGLAAVFLVIELDGQIPQGGRVVGTGHGDHAVVAGMPLDRRDGFLVEVEVRDGAGPQLRIRRRTAAAATLRLPLPQIPHRPASVVGARRQQVERLARPRHDVDVRVADLDVDRRLAALAAHIPHLDGAVGAGGREHEFLVRRPLQLLHRVGVADERPRVCHPPAAFCALSVEDLACIVAGEESAVWVGRDWCPVQGVAFGLVHA